MGGAKMKTRIGLATLVVVLLAGCGIARRQQDREAYTHRMDSLVGKSVDDLVKSEGPPTSTFILAQGGAVFEYSKTRQVTRGGGSFTLTQPTLVGNTLVNVPQQHALPVHGDTQTCQTLVTITADQRVESWKHDGRGC
jgi:hypothetical protein